MSAIIHLARVIPARKGRMARPKRVVALCAAIELKTTTDPREVTCRRCLARLAKRRKS